MYLKIFFSFQTDIEGELRSLEDGERFVFKVKEDHNYNQKRYEALGEVKIRFLMAYSLGMGSVNELLTPSPFSKSVHTCRFS